MNISGRLISYGTNESNYSKPVLIFTKIYVPLSHFVLNLHFFCSAMISEAIFHITLVIQIKQSISIKNSNNQNQKFIDLTQIIIHTHTDSMYVCI